MDPVYLDYNATAPLAPEVREAMAPWWDGPANPSAAHRHGQAARDAIERARTRVADLFGQGAEVVFTSGGTEADNQVLWSACGWPPAGHLVISPVEHPAILEPAGTLAAAGVGVSLLEVDRHGRVDPDGLEEAIRDDTRLVSVMAANNEIGTLQPVAELAERAHVRGLPFHTDAVQAIAWSDPAQLLGDADYVSLSAHKIGGPPGVGALVVRNGRDLAGWIRGGNQQRGRRGGTEPVALAVGFGAACARVARERESQAERVRELSLRLLDGLRAEVPDLLVTCGDTPRLPNTVHLCVRGADGAALVARLDLEGVAASAGSACSSGLRHRSGVLEAIGLDAEHRAGALRFSLGYESRDDDVERALRIVPSAVAGVRHALARG